MKSISIFIFMKGKKHRYEKGRIKPEVPGSDWLFPNLYRLRRERSILLELVILAKKPKRTSKKNDESPET